MARLLVFIFNALISSERTARCPDFINKDAWPPNSPDLNPLDYHVWGWMLDKFNRLNPQPKNIPEQKTALLMIWDDCHKKLSENQSSASASVCALVSTQKGETLNINCKIV